MRPTKAMVAAMISPLTIAILEGWSPKFVQLNRLALVLNGLENRRDLYAGWVARGRESLALWERKLAEAEHAHHGARADDQVRYYLASLRDYEGRLRAVTKFARVHRGPRSARRGREPHADLRAGGSTLVNVGRRAAHSRSKLSALRTNRERRMGAAQGVTG